MIKDTRTNEVIEEYELREDHHRYSYSKLLGKKSKFNFKCTKDDNVYFKPYSTIFRYNYPYDSFNNKKFSII